MATPLQQLMDDIEALIELRLTERLAKIPLQYNTEAASYAQFEAAFMAKHDGQEPVNQGLFRTFLRWLDQFYAYRLNFDADIVKQSIRVSDIISGTYTAPDATTYTGLSPVLTELFTRVDIVDGELHALEQSQIALTGVVNGHTASIGTLNAHTANQALHLIPDEISILTDATKLKIQPSYVRGLFSASNPVAISAEGAVSLKIDPAKMELTAGGELSVKETASVNTTYTISFNAVTSELTLTPSVGVTQTINLESLKTGGAIDMNDYVKKTAASQTITGALIITGGVKSSVEIEAFAP
jgi:hypothetical protein